MTIGIGGSTVERELEAIKPWQDCARAIEGREYEERLRKLQQLLAESNLDAILVGAGASLNYFTGVGWGASERLVAMLLPVQGQPLVVCPKFELGTLQACLAIPVQDLRCWQEHEDPYRQTADILRALHVTKLAIDPAFAYGMVDRLRREASSVQLLSATPQIDGCRMCKSPAEVALLQQAKSMTLEVQRRVARVLRPGISASEVRQFIDDAHRRLGASGSSFCIVLFGEATSYPHGVPGELYLNEGDVVLIDTGCLVGGYNSDITRTYVYGEPTSEQRRIWDLEQAAQQAGFEAAALGAPCEKVDYAAREVLTRAGLGPDYELPGLPHRTGHGIGLSIHEAPYLVRGDRTRLAVGMCFSNEPTIVLPEKFGIRLEDHFYMTEDGPAWFTQPSPAIDRPFG